MIWTNTEFGKLKSIIVGKEMLIEDRLIDLTFKAFYNDNLQNNSGYKSEYSYYKITKDLIYKRNQQLDDLAGILSSFGVQVFRPTTLKKLVRVQSPYFSSYLSPASNVRDITFTYNNRIIETPVMIRNRQYENMQLYDIFNTSYDNGKGGQWIKAPHTKLIKQSLDLDDWRNNRDFTNIPKNFEMAIDGAQFLKIGKDVIVNISTYNHYLGLQWVKSFFPETRFHIIKTVDNHIDGCLMVLCPGVFLVQPSHYKDIYSQLPDKFKKWKFLCPQPLAYKTDDNTIRIASSEGMDINVLSIDEKTVLVNKRAINVIRILEDNRFNIVPIELDNCEIFGGGIHCSTLDLVRNDEYIDY